MKSEATIQASAGTQRLRERWSALSSAYWRLEISPLWLVVAPMVLTIVVLLVTIFWMSFIVGLPGTPEAHFSIDNYITLYADPFVVTALVNTLGFAMTTMFVALFFGVSIAWFVERTDLPGKSSIYTVMSLGILLPGFFTAMGWLFLLHPRIGIINRWIMDFTGLTTAPLSITNLIGMGWVQGLNLTALAFIMTTASFRSMDPALEEAATVHGASFSQMLRSVFAPLMLPGLAASAIYIFTISIGVFDTPAIIGLSNRIFTFSTYVYTQSITEDALPNYGAVAAMSALMTSLAILLAYFYSGVIKKSYQYQVVTGKGYRPNLYKLGGWTGPVWCFIGLYFFLSKLLPLLLLIWASLLQYFQPPSMQAFSSVSLQNFRDMPFDLLARSGLNTAILTVTVPTVAVAISFGFSWMVVRSNFRFRTILDFFAFLPHAVPSIIFGVGALFVALFILTGIPLYGSLTLLGIVYVVDRLTFGTRLLNSALIQVHHDLEEAATVCGATGLKVARSVLAPLVWPAILSGWLWMGLLTLRELTLATILFTPNNVTMPVVIWSIWSSGNYGVASSITLVLLLCLAPLVLLYWIIGRRAMLGN